MMRMMAKMAMLMMMMSRDAGGEGEEGEEGGGRWEGERHRLKSNHPNLKAGEQAS